MKRQAPNCYQKRARERLRVRLPAPQVGGYYEGVLMEIIAEIPFRGRAKMRLDSGRILVCKVANLELAEQVL